MYTNRHIAVHGCTHYILKYFLVHGMYQCKIIPTSTYLMETGNHSRIRLRGVGWNRFQATQWSCMA